MLKRAQKILQCICKETASLDLNHLEQDLQKLYIFNLSQKSGILPNNLSTELQILFQQGHLIRIKGRPVIYASLKEMELLLNRSINTLEFANLKAFLAYVQSGKEPELQNLYDAEASAPLSSPHAFDRLIGADSSLYESIEQAKAAILYPPHGLHTLITGPSGVGKSMFASCMYEYGVEMGALEKNAPFVTLNCANYADNPQLLLSLLFGHVKGSFTGAYKDQAGLVEVANQGVLFLDEIHRLSPEGQEKLFLLLDKGVYQKLGDSKHEYHAQILLIGATTESPSECMLSTFLRRIPSYIELPPLAERSVRERLTLTLYLLWKESRNLRHNIYLNPEVLSAFVHYFCVANVGQLEKDIKLTCANTYYQYRTGHIRRIQIGLSNLGIGILHGLYISPGASSQLIEQNLLPHQKVISIEGTRPFQEILDACLTPNHR